MPDPQDDDQPLDKEQRKALEKALRSAFGSKPALERMFSAALNENLDEISLGGNLRDLVFHLVQWVCEQNRVEELITGACKVTPRNALLHKFEQDWTSRKKAVPERASPSLPNVDAAARFQRLLNNAPTDVVAYAEELADCLNDADASEGGSLWWEIFNAATAFAQDDEKQEQLFHRFATAAEKGRLDEKKVKKLHPVIKSCVSTDNPQAQERLCTLLDLCCTDADQDDSGWDGAIATIVSAWRFFRHRRRTHDLAVTAICNVVKANRRDTICAHLDAGDNKDARVLLRDRKLIELDVCPLLRSLRYTWPSVSGHPLNSWEDYDTKINSWLGWDRPEAHPLVVVPSDLFLEWLRPFSDVQLWSYKCAVYFCPTNHDAAITALAFQHQHDYLTPRVADGASAFYLPIAVELELPARTVQPSADSILAQCARAYGEFWLQLLTNNPWLWDELSESRQKGLSNLLAWGNEIADLEGRFQEASPDARKMRPDLQHILDKIRRLARPAGDAGQQPSRQELLLWLNQHPLPPEPEHKGRTLLLIYWKVDKTTMSLKAAAAAWNALKDLSKALENTDIFIRAFMAAAPGFHKPKTGLVEQIQLAWNDKAHVRFIENYSKTICGGNGIGNLFARSAAGQVLEPRRSEQDPLLPGPLLRQLIDASDRSPAQWLLLLRSAMSHNPALVNEEQPPREEWGLDDEDIEKAVRAKRRHFA